MAISLATPTPSNRQVYQCQLMTNGKVLFVLDDLSTYIWEPAATGIYRNGFFRRVEDVPYSSQYGNMTVLSDGRIVQHTGEYGTSLTIAPGDWVCIFDPSTEKWTAKSGGWGGHTPNQLSDDGRLFRTTSRVPINNVPLTSLATANGFVSPMSDSESELILTPDGKMVGFDGIGGSSLPTNFFRVLTPGYDARFIADGSVSGSLADAKVDVSTAFDSITAHWRLPNSNERRRWYSPGPLINYEHGVAVWSTRLNKAVLLSGTGHILSKSANTTNELTYQGFIGMEPQYPDVRSTSQYLGVVKSTNNGATPASIATAGTFTFTLPVGGEDTVVSDMNTHTTKYFYIRLGSNSKWVCFTYTSVARSGADAVVSGVALHPTWPGANWDGSTLATNDQVCFGRPSYQCMDSPACVLPDGSILFAAGVENKPRAGDFNTNAFWMRWDPATTVATHLASDLSGKLVGADFVAFCFPLPDGDILLVDGGLSPNLKFYTPSGAEATPVANARPVITSGAISVRAGDKFSISGTGFNGLNEGGYFGDDKTPRTNFPIVSLTNTTTGKVYYCFTHNLFYRGIQPLRANVCDVGVPLQTPPGSYTMSISANGIPSSATVSVTVAPAIAGEPTMITRYGV